MSSQTLQTLKRAAEDINDELNNDEFDVTWGGKRSRYIYNYVLQSPDLYSNDSDLTDSTHSIQSKVTIQAHELEELDFSSVSSCGSSCSCPDSCQSVNTEFEVMSSSSSNCKINYFDSSDSSLLLEHEIPKNIILHNETPYSTDNGYLPDEKDEQVIIPKKKLPPPACFKICLQCKKENPNPYYQYCHKCFRYRLQFFENKPNPMPKSIKRLSKMAGRNEDNSPINSQTLEMINTQESNSSGISSLFMSQEKINEDCGMIDMVGKNENICNICFINVKNSIFNHGKTGHVYACYYCAKAIWKKSGKCPICQLKIRYVTKMIVV